MNAKPPLLLLAAGLALAACGSGDDGSGTSVSSSEAAREFSSDLSRAERLLAANSTLTPTMPDMLPTGRAEFDGKVAMAFGGAPATFAGADLIGDVDLNADFRTGTITGWLDDFNTSDGRQVRGDLEVRSGTITGSDFAAVIGGRLTGPATAPGNVAGTIEGTFLGDGAGGVAGAGSATTDAGAAALVFQAQREFD